MALCPTVRLLFPLGRATRHRASPPLLPSFLDIGSSPSLFFLVLGYFLVWPYCPYMVCIAVAVLDVLYVVYRGMHIDVLPAIQL